MVMQPFKWNKKHEVFVPELDAEHRNLFRIAEELRVALAAGAGGEQVQALLGALLAGAEDHFRHEERLMRAAGYPSYEWHRQQHDTVRKRVKGFSTQIAAGEPEALTAMLEFLAIWLREHTSLTDRMMCAYIRNYRRLHSALAS
jgi:hemerythrin